MKEGLPGVRIENVSPTKEHGEERNEQVKAIEEWIKTHYTIEGGAPALLRLFGIQRGSIAHENVGHSAHIVDGKITYSPQGLDAFASSIAAHLLAAERALQLPKSIVKYGGIIHPPGDGALHEPTSENPEKYSEGPYIPRTLFFLQLMAEMRMECVVVQGEEHEKIMRAEGYQTFYLGEPMNKLVSLSNAWGEATYIQFSAQDNPESWASFLNMKKEEMRVHDDIVRVLWTGSAESWKSMLFYILKQESPEAKSIPLIKLKTLLKTSDQAIAALVPELLQHNPPFAVRGKGKSTYVTSEGLAYLRTFIPGKDWLSAINIKKQMQERGGAADQDTIRKRMAELKEQYPTDVLPIENKGLYASPRVVEMIVREFLARRTAPEGWRTFRATAALLIKKDGKVGILEKTLQNLIGRLQAEGIDVPTEEYRDAIGHVRKHIGPQGFQILQDALNSEK